MRERVTFVRDIRENVVNVTLIDNVFLRRRSQVGRQRSAKSPCIGSNPIAAFFCNIQFFSCLRSQVERQWVSPNLHASVLIN